MTAIHFTEVTTSTPEQFIAGLTDFGPGRSKLFANSHDDYLQVHDQGPGFADVTEGSGGVWERLHYDWSDPNHVVLTTTDSNVWGGDSGHTYTFTRRADGRTEIDVVIVRDGKNAQGPAARARLQVLRQARPGQAVRRHRPGHRGPQRRDEPGGGVMTMTKLMRKARNLLAVVFTAVLLLAGTTTAQAAPSVGAAIGKATIVLLHGAYADGSSWSEVIRRLQGDGYTVVAPAVPLRGIASDTVVPARRPRDHPRAEGAGRTLLRRRAGQRTGGHARGDVAGLRGRVHPRSRRDAGRAELAVPRQRTRPT